MVNIVDEYNSMSVSGYFQAHDGHSSNSVLNPSHSRSDYRSTLATARPTSGSKMPLRETVRFKEDDDGQGASESIPVSGMSLDYYLCIVSHLHVILFCPRYT